MGTALLGFAAASLLLVVLPGPDTLVVVRNLVQGGRPRAMATVAGVLTGLVLWVVAASLGLAAVLHASRTGYEVLRDVGAAYLVWVGISALGAHLRGAPRAPWRRPLLGTGFPAGLLTDVLNPKIGVTFVAVLPTFTPPGYGVAAASLLLGGVYVLETLAYFVVLLWLAERVVGWMQDPRSRRRIDRGAGLVFIGLGVRLAVSSG